MKSILKFVFLTIIIFVVGFFFWGSSSTLDQDEYTVISIKDSATTPISNDTFSIVTYNIGYLSGMTNNKAISRSKQFFNANLSQSISLFKSISPDFIAFQEIDFDASRSYNVDQMEALATENQYDYSSKAINWDKQYVPFPYWPVTQQFGKIVSGQAVLSRFPITKNTITPLIKPESNPFYYNAFYLDRLAQLTQVEIGNNTLFILNVHLEAFDAETRNKQIKTVLGIVHRYSEKFPIILCGDFNSTPPGATNPWQDDNVIKTMLADFQLEMAINMEANKKSESSYYTFNSDAPERRIDYFFYNPKFIKILDARVLNEANQISDHLPVWMKFTLR